MRLTANRDSSGATGKWPSATMVAAGASQPAPIEGWDAVSPLASMSPKRAVRLDNWFPQPGWVEIRKGYRRWASTGTGLPVETLAAYQGVASQNLFAAAGSAIFDVTVESVVTQDVAALTNVRFQYINFATTGGNFLYMVNGADDPQYYDGSAWNVAAITGVSGGDIIGVNAHKNRLWFTLKDSSNAAYLPVDNIQGAASVFPLGGLFTKGGYLMAMGTWSIDAGTGPDDYAVFVSSRGQVAIYSGTDPSTAATWKLVGVFDMGAPIGRRCLTRVGADIAIICIDGVVPLSRAMIFERAAVQKVALTANIQHVMNDSARNYKDNFGWQLISYPRGTRAILNVPLVENQTQQQYVMNTLSGAWCRFTNMNANCWELLSDDIYFGGNDGDVFLADTGGGDQSGVMRADMMTAFNYYGVRGRQKRWMMCRPQLTTDGIVAPGLAFNVDFGTNAPITEPSLFVPLMPSLWGNAGWGSSPWASPPVAEQNWTSVSGIGYCASIRMVVAISPTPHTLPALWGISLWGTGLWSGGTTIPSVTLQVNSFDVTMESGAMV